MGHAGIRTTFNPYGHLFEDKEDELVARLNARWEKVGANAVGFLLGHEVAPVIDLREQGEKRAVDRRNALWTRGELNP